VLLVVLAFWSLVNIRGVALGVRLNSIATVAKLLPLLLIAMGGLFFIDPENLRSPAMPAAADVARTSLLLIFAFAGIEVALVPSGEVRDTARTVPRAIALAMVGITVLYLALQISSQGILGDGLAEATIAPLADAAGASMGGWARTLLLGGAVLSMFGYLGGMTLSMPRMLFALARDGFLPRRLAEVHPTYRSPQLAIVVQSLLTVALAATGTFEKLAVLANVSALALYFGCALAAWRLRQLGVRGQGGVPFRVPFGGVVPWLACAVILWLLTGLTRDEWLAFGAGLAVGTLVYFGTSRHRSRPAPGIGAQMG
jgi:amino acid transporter